MSTADDGKAGYHHGDLRAALLSTAMRMLEAGEPFSLRAVARETGVSTAAPYRHFPDRESLESALAAQGLRDLRQTLLSGTATSGSIADLAELAVGYVGFALDRPALFHLMFGQPCDDANDERVQAADELHRLIAAAVQTVVPGSDPAALTDLATAGWALVHGLAVLLLDGKLVSASRADAEQQVRTIFLAAFAAHADVS